MPTTYVPGNWVLAGATRGGKSLSHARVVVDAMEQRRLMSIVVIDPHARSLAWEVTKHGIARGHAARFIYDRLSDLKRAPGYSFLRVPQVHDPVEWRSQVDQFAWQLVDVLIYRRKIDSLASAPQTEEWTLAAVLLLIEQRESVPAFWLKYAFQPGSWQLQQLIADCRNLEVVARFRQVASGRIRPHEYAAAKRIIDRVCNAPAFALRSARTFDLYNHLDHGGILAVEGGGMNISDDAASVVMGAIILQVIAYVRSRPRPNPRVLLVIDEAVNWGLIGPHEVRALAETQKMGLDVHILVQNPTFADPRTTEGVFNNTAVHCWHYAAFDDAARRAAADLGDPEYRDSLRKLKPGERYVKERSEVYFEYVPLLDDPWTIPGLCEAKTRLALEQIRARPEYSDQAWLAQQYADEQRFHSTIELADDADMTESDILHDLVSTSQFQEPDADLNPDEACIALAERHICVPRHFAKFFKSQAACYRRIRTLIKRGQLKQIGYVAMTRTGRPSLVISNGWQPPINLLRHEVHLTDCLLALESAFPGTRVVRGPHVDSEIRPDAEVRLVHRPERVFVELDTGSIPHKRVNSRKRIYAGLSEPALLLFVTLSKRRRDALLSKRRDGAARGHGSVTMLASVLDEFVQDATGVVWRNVNGEAVGL